MPLSSGIKFKFTPSSAMLKAMVTQWTTLSRIDLSRTDVTDVSALGNVHTLNLQGCEGVTDVSALGNVHTLNLRGCRGVTDVSALGKVHNLTLY
ncbi:hypothetical protein [Candidatus Odyssella acanthamoebae]|uniref:Uncharacterized protein n=1 Tax=Candidatus Odyssella acanthamoebae TaxID=91604 RepID=A0A077AVJ5_9PROT|nr:hypothetical protein [Candidatus Paracaedibacter acanthamoebae]AIK96064.1 hypothetical protein ID47_03840 [Candidatus Paracaedibacter acanthamoebae]